MNIDEEQLLSGQWRARRCDEGETARAGAAKRGVEKEEAGPVRLEAVDDIMQEKGQPSDAVSLN